MKTYKNRYINDMIVELERERITREVFNWVIVAIAGLFFGLLFFISFI